MAEELLTQEQANEELKKLLQRVYDRELNAEEGIAEMEALTNRI